LWVGKSPPPKNLWGVKSKFKMSSLFYDRRNCTIWFFNKIKGGGSFGRLNCLSDNFGK
jgi:hypothetical protein